MELQQRQPKQTSLSIFFEGNSSKRKPGSSLSSDKKRKRFVRKSGSSFGSCPLCNRSLPWHNLEQHASTCQGEAGSSNAGVANNQKHAVNEGSAQRVDQYQPSDEPIPGLFIYENFITEEEEAMILAELDGKPISIDDHDGNSSVLENNHLPWKLANFNGIHYGKRWGVHCNLRDRMVSEPEHPLPWFMQKLLLPRLKRLKPMSGCNPNEANAIDYRRNLRHYLASHVDDRQLSKEPIANLSLAGSCFMTFRNEAHHRNTAVSMARVYLPRRCLQVLTGKARYDFSHGIAHCDLLSDRRVSVTMRESPLTVRIKDRLGQVNTSLKPLGSTIHSTAKRSDANTRKAHSQIEHSLSLVPSRQERLCHTDEPLPGLFVFEDFITAEEEELILNELDSDPNQKWGFEKHSGRLCEKRFGVDHDLWNPYSVRPGKFPLPRFTADILLPRLRRLSASVMQGCIPNQVNSISYRRSQGHFLASHVDDRKKHKEPIANLSLSGDCLMTYKYQGNGANGTTGSLQTKVLLKRRCLQVMTGQVRYYYAHGIENKDLLSDRRVSVTMRETKVT